MAEEDTRAGLQVVDALLAGGKAGRETLKACLDTLHSSLLVRRNFLYLLHSGLLALDLSIQLDHAILQLHGCGCL